MGGGVAKARARQRCAFPTTNPPPSSLASRPLSPLAPSPLAKKKNSPTKPPPPAKKRHGVDQPQADRAPHRHRLSAARERQPAQHRARHARVLLERARPPAGAVPARVRLPRARHARCVWCGQRSRLGGGGAGARVCRFRRSPRAFGARPAPPRSARRLHHHHPPTHHHVTPTPTPLSLSPPHPPLLLS